MSAAKLALDPLWQCLCPKWTSQLPMLHSTRRILFRKQPLSQCLRITSTRRKSNYLADIQAKESRDDGALHFVLSPLADAPPLAEKRKRRQGDTPLRRAQFLDDSSAVERLRQEPTQSLYGLLRADAVDGKVVQCREIARMLIEERNEKPSHPIYDALILSNVHNAIGSAWRVAELLDEMEDDGLQPDSQTCHAVLKVLSVHLDHLLRNDVLEYMSSKWIQLSEDGAHDVVAGLLREGLFEQALAKLDNMQGAGMQIRPWLLDMAVYVLCEANEISEAHRIMRQRFDSPEQQSIGRSLWAFFLDKASSARHHAATALVWSNQVNRKYINAPSGVCLNVLATAAQAGDAVMATEVFLHLSKRSTPFQAIHYEMLISTYLAADPPDLPRAMTVLSIMAGEKLEPSSTETRAIYLYLCDRPDLLPAALQTLHELHEQDRIIPIAALNVLIECHIEHGDFKSALKLYKQIHTFVQMSAGVQRTFANAETFNLLLKGCRLTQAPDADQASFLLSEMLDLGVKADSMTYDRSVLVFTTAAQHAFTSALTSTGVMTTPVGLDYLDKGFHQFMEMQAQKMPPRLGTVDILSVTLASMGDARCWDVLQAGDDDGARIPGWEMKGRLVRRKVEEAWEQASRDGVVVVGVSDGARRMEEMPG